LFEERRKINKNINETEAEHNKLLEDKTINEHSILSKLNEILEERREKSERKDRIEYIKSLEDKFIDERAFSKLKEVLKGERKRKDEIEPILSKLKEVLEGNGKRSEIESILSRLKEILERNIEKKPTSEKVSTIKEKPTSEKVSTIKEKPTFEKVSTIKEEPTSEKVSTIKEKPTSEKVSTIKEKPTSEKVSTIKEKPTSEKVSTIKEKLTSEKVSTIKEKPTSEKVSTIKEKPTSEKVSTIKEKPIEEEPTTECLDKIFIFDVDKILEHQKYLDDDVVTSVNAVVNYVSDVSDVNYVNNVNDLKDLPQHNNQYLIEFDDTLYLDYYEAIFDVDKILEHQKYLDDDIVTSVNAVVNYVSDVSDVNYVNNVNDLKDLPQHNNQYLIEFDDTLYLDNYEVIFDVDEILKHQNYLDNEIVSDNVPVIVNDLDDLNGTNDINDGKILFNISVKNYLYNYNFVEEFDDNLYIVDSGEDISPPPPYSEKDDNLNAIRESLPSPYNQCDVNTLKDILPADYNKLDNVTIINIIQQNIIYVKQGNNDQDNDQDSESSLFKTFKKIVKEVENLVDKAAKAHQAAVNIEKLRRSSNNSSKPELSENEKEIINAGK
jgi:hypothetical protein